MISYKKLTGPFGIPVYHQRLPDMVESVALSWFVFTGSADDHLVGADGAYHWFEHVPFRGTKRYPNGYADIKGRFTARGGNIGAMTNCHCTHYWAHVHLEQWREAFNVITDLWAQPLARDEDVEAERTIIHKEIKRKVSRVDESANYRMGEILMPGHPLGHPVLGSIESLRSITAKQLRMAHAAGYDRSRVVLVVNGNIPEEEVLAELEQLAYTLPDNGLDERRSPAQYGRLPDWAQGDLQFMTDFASTLVHVLFTVPRTPSIKVRMALLLLDKMATHGGLDSPLYRIVREERNLAYNCGSSCRLTPDGGYWGLQLETERANIGRGKRALLDVLADPVFKSPERLDQVKQGLSYERRMRSVSPREFNMIAFRQLTNLGAVMGDQEVESMINEVGFKELRHLARSMHADSARTLIFIGKGQA